MKFMMVNNSTEAANSLMKKLAKQTQPGAIIPLTQDEWDAYNQDVVLINMGGEDESPLLEVERGKDYLLFVDPATTNIDDINRAIAAHDVRISVIRSKGRL